MRKIDDFGLTLCKFVSNLFEYSTKNKECSSKIFVKAYVFSTVCKRLSSNRFLLEALDVEAAYDIIKNEKNLSIRGEVYPSYVMSWIGFIMKYFSYVTYIPETILYKKIKPQEFYQMYEAYHSLDNDLAVKRIAEAKSINLELNDSSILKSI